MRVLRFHPICLLFAVEVCLSAQTSRIAGRIDASAAVELRGTVPSRARSGIDRGRADSSFVLPDLAMLFKPSPEQQADLDQFLTDLQNPASPSYHRWLTPEEYANRFGVSQSDLDKFEGWLTGQGFRVSYRARGRNWIAFSGTAGQVEQTFRAPIHRVWLDGQEHYSNVTNAVIPAAVEGIVGTLTGMHDFRLKPFVRVHPRTGGPGPNYNDSFGSHYLAPDDLAAILYIPRLRS